MTILLPKAERRQLIDFCYNEFMETATSKKLIKILKPLLVLGLVSSLMGNIFLLATLDKSKKQEETPGITIPRGRPQIKNGTVLTDAGTLMRGMVFGVYELQMEETAGNKLVTYQDIAAIKEQGLNCLRLSIPLQYVQKDSEDYFYCLQAADEFIAWAKELGLYVWLSADIVYDDSEYGVDFASIWDYWTVLAPRYAAEPHVFYDLVNELSEIPEFLQWSHPYGTVIDFYVELYTFIRKVAPDTLCIFFSFSHLVDMEAVILQIEDLQQRLQLTWTNEAIGFHGYEATNKYDDGDIWLNSVLLKEEIRRFKDAGYPIINTEVPSQSMSYDDTSQLTDYPNTYLLKVLEEEGVSWVTMLDIMSVGSVSTWRGNVERSGLTWQADYGTWPQSGLTNPYQTNAAIINSQKHQAFVSLAENATPEEVGNVYKNYIPSLIVLPASYVTYPQVNFGVLEPVSLTIRMRSFYQGTKVGVHEGGSTGPLLCEFILADTKGENDYYTVNLRQGVSGIKDLTFTFTGPEGQDCWLLGNFIDWQFNLPPVLKATLHHDIWNKRLAFSDYNYHRGNLVRQPNTDQLAQTKSGKSLQLANVKDGDQLLFDFVPFVPVRDITFKVRAKTLAGGKIEIYANKGFRIWPGWSIYLGSCQINGSPGRWEEFTLTIPQELANQVVYGGSWNLHGLDLMLRFVANDGVGADQQLFELSEFSFLAEKMKEGVK